MLPTLPLRRLLLLLIAAWFSGCGGGGGGIVTLEAGAAAFDFELIRADVPASRTIEVDNPLEEEATVELVDEAQNVILRESELPQTVANGAAATLTVILEPRAPGTIQGSFTLRFVGTTTIQELAISLGADAEQPRLTAGTLELAFSQLEVGEEEARTFTLTNTSVVTPIELRTLSGVPAGFRVSPGLPLTLFPGQSQTFGVSYTASFGTGDIATTLAIRHSADAAPITIDLRAESSLYRDREVIDFGDVAITNRSTDFLELDVDADAVSITLEANGPSNIALGLAEFTGPGDTVFENAELTGPLLWTPATEVFSIVAPNSDDSGVQLAPGGGRYRFRISIISGASPATVSVRAIVQRRPNAVVESGVIDLNVFLADGLSITPETAASDTRLQQILGEADRIFRQRGLQLGDIDYYKLTDASLDQVESNAEFRQLLETSSEATETRLNLYFVLTAFGGGTLGVAARVSGPTQNGTRHSGVMVDFDFGSTATAGYVTAHEIGHFLGLYHTTESGGSHDNIEDTLECPANGTDDVCSRVGNSNMMHWRILGIPTPDITVGQSGVILVHPFVRLIQQSQLAARRPAGTGATAVEELSENWCGCAAAASKSVKR